LHEVVLGIFAWVQPDGTWWLNNAGAVVGDGGVLIVDTCATEARTRRFLGAVAEATGDAPVRALERDHVRVAYRSSLVRSITPGQRHDSDRSPEPGAQVRILQGAHRTRERY
jgi:hypothetical protein